MRGETDQGAEKLQTATLADLLSRLIIVGIDPGKPGSDPTKRVKITPEILASLISNIGLDQNAQPGDYTLVATDAGKHIYHASGALDTYTIPANASVPFEIGTAVTFVNMAADDLSIAITTDTMNLAGDGATGTRTLAQYGVATALKVTSTLWIISGSGLT